MINDLRNDITSVFRNNKQYLPIRVKERLMIYIIYLKYLCETNKLEYEKVIHSDEIYGPKELYFGVVPIDNINVHGLNALIRNFTNISAIDMLKELINELKDDNDFYSIKGKRIVDVWETGYYYRNEDLSMFDITGKTTYVISPQNEELIEYFKIFDEILGVNNKYLKRDEIDYKKYDNLCIFVKSPKYVNNDDGVLFKYIYDSLKLINVSLYSKFSRFSRFTLNGRSKDKENRVLDRFLARHIKTVLIKEDNMIIIFNSLANEISIINCNKLTRDEIDDIITNNRKQKDVLVKTNYDELIKNGLRIGFNLYQKKKDNNEIDINKIVDENTYYLDELNTLNEVVERETNRIFNL